MKTASFSLKNYKFDKIEIDLENKISNEINLSFKPSGSFSAENSEFILNLIFRSFNESIEQSFIKIECKATFKFEENITIDDIPKYFYANSIAIIFPYIRAFVSNITLQANIHPLILPTMNLISLEKDLKEHTKTI